MELIRNITLLIMLISRTWPSKFENHKWDLFPRVYILFNLINYFIPFEITLQLILQISHQERLPNLFLRYFSTFSASYKSNTRQL